jgi:sugar phosphate isomerase/epimerase
MVGDIRLFDYIMQNTDPKLVAQQMDIGNMYSTGENDALYLINKYPGRFESMHVKDEIKSAPKRRYRLPKVPYWAAGVLPVKEILKAAKKGGTCTFIIEQESYQGKDPIDCVKIDLQTMKKWGY